MLGISNTKALCNCPISVGWECAAASWIQMQLDKLKDTDLVVIILRNTSREGKETLACMRKEDAISLSESTYKILHLHKIIIYPFLKALTSKVNEQNHKTCMSTRSNGYL